MKRIYEEPTIETLIINGTVIVSISGQDGETSTPNDEYDNMFG